MDNKYLIEGFKWFDKINGNSYFSVDITRLKNNKLIISTGICYGYGDQYIQKGYTELVKLGLCKEKDRFNHDLNNKRFIYREIKNCLKRDLKPKMIN